jgi:DASS family divalent anion:Na+ symporter
MSLAEKILAFDFVLLILLWTVGDIFFSIPATLSAFIGLMVLLISNIMSWKNIIEEKRPGTPCSGLPYW